MPPPPRSSLLCSWRLMTSFIAFFGFVMIYTQRVGMSVAIVCMVNHTALGGDEPIRNGDTNNNYSYVNHTSEYGGCADNTVKSKAVKDGPFVWPKEVQGHILGSFFYGYLLSQVPGGVLAERFGGRKILALFVALSTLATLLSPLAASTSYIALIVARIFVGIGSGAIFPAMNALWGHWAPPMERTKLAGLSYAGAMFGNVVGFPAAGALCKEGFDGGWPSIFYVFGGVTVVWLVVWLALVSDRPATHRCVRARERDYIIHSLRGQQLQHSKPRLRDIPWGKFVMSPPVWAIVIANVTSDWGLSTLLTNIPTYMHEVLHFDIQSNGLLSALPFIGLTVCMTLCPLVVDRIMSSGLLAPTATRKLFQCIGSFGAAGFLVGLAFTDCSSPHVAIVCLTLGVTVTGCTYSAFLVNHMDLAPRFAGTLFGISNGLAAVPGFIAPYVTAVLTKTKSHAEWQRVFFISAAVYVFGALVYVVCASAELQPWAKTEEEHDDVIVNGGTEAVP